MPVVVGFAPSPDGHAAVAFATDEARRRGTSLIVVNSQRGGSSLSADDAIVLRHELERIRGDLLESGLEFEVRALVLGNSPAHDLIAVVEDTDAEVLVVGMAPRSPVGKLFVGSVAQDVLLMAPVPVIAVKAVEP